jgi:cell division protein ZapA (FtsZ GTPase activity inhibitor)
MTSQLQSLINLQNEALRNLSQKSEAIQNFRNTVERSTPEQLRSLAVDFSRQLSELESANRQLLQQALAILQELEKSEQATGKKTASVRPEEVAKQFRNLIETIQLDARRPSASQSAATLKSMDIELKGLIVVEKEEARIVTPTPGQEINPNQLSTIRMSFGAIPVLPITEEPTTEPPQ